MHSSVYREPNVMCHPEGNGLGDKFTHLCPPASITWLLVSWGENPCNVAFDKWGNILPAHHPSISENPCGSSRSWVWAAKLQWIRVKYSRHGIMLCGRNLLELLHLQTKGIFFALLEKWTKLGKQWTVTMVLPPQEVQITQFCLSLRDTCAHMYLYHIHCQGNWAP